VPWLDVLIASVGLQDNVRVYAIDAHFREISTRTGLILYEPGYGGGYAGENG
jgi:hypothetical protein